jgi:hypothetical protein
MGNKMEQESGNNSTNLQIGGNVSIGISATEARQIALDIFKANFYEFSEKAAKKALERAEEITDEFISKFYSQIPHLESKLEEPSVQSSMFNTQKEYAKTGDVDLKEQLLDLLIQRIDSDERSLKQIVLDEAIILLPKLTKDQINIITLLFSAIYFNHSDILNLAKLSDYINNKLVAFYPKDKTSYSFFNHLQYTGCCTILSEGSTYKPLIQIFQSRYKALFSKGFSTSELLEEFKEDLPQIDPLLMRSFRNPIQFQFNALNDEVFNAKIGELNLGQLGQKAMAFENKFLMNEQEIENYLVTINSDFKKLSIDWNGKDLKTISPTSVGFAIAIMNYNRHTNSNIAFESFI